jgi:hypothetical protein
MFGSGAIALIVMAMFGSGTLALLYARYKVHVATICSFVMIGSFEAEIGVRRGAADISAGHFKSHNQSNMPAICVSSTAPTMYDSTITRASHVLYI